MRRWSELSRVERVGLYTRQSLYLMLWTFNGAILLSAPGAAVVPLAGGIAVTALSQAALAPLLHRRAADRRRIVALLTGCAAYLAVAELTFTDPARGGAVLVVIVATSVVFGLLGDLRVALALVAACGVVTGVSGSDWINFGAGIAVAGLAVVTVRVSMWLLVIVTDLDEASGVRAQLAVAEERLRFSRDVHDVLGRRLSTIAVQAELAATLAVSGDPRAAERMLEVRGVAHEALREARQLARGYRETDFANELDGARSLLRSAGIEVRLGVDELPGAWHEAAAWVVRESVTNVLRHSSARVVEISYAQQCLRVDNDGARSDSGGDGSGLRGLRERLAPLGASLSAGAVNGGRWAVVAELPASGPQEAA